jgi:hypothetical protein
MRITSCIFKRPLTRITAQPGNKVRCRHGKDNLKRHLKTARLQDNLKTSRQLEDCRASRCTAVKDSFNLTRL